MFKDTSVISSSHLSRKIFLLALVCLAALFAIPNRAALASLTGDTVNVQFLTGPVKQVTVGAGVELPNAGPTLGAVGNSPRWNIDLDSSTIRIDFIDQVATYGLGAFFLFSDLDPKIGACPGTVVGVTVVTNKPVAQFDVAGAMTFTANSVRVQIAPSAGNVNWSPGEFIELRLTYRAAPGCNPCVTPPAGLKLWLPFDETSGAVANDIAGFNNIGLHGPTPARPTPAAGVVAGALSFDGQDDYVEVANATDIDMLGNCVLDIADSFTIDAWIRTSSAANLQTILDKRAQPIGQSAPAGYHLYLSNGRVGFQMGDGSTFSNFTAPSAPVNDGQPHFIAVVVKRCRPAFGNIYVDGQLVHTFAPIISNLSNNANLLIGKRHPAFSANYFNGVIDELEIFKNALSAADLNAIFAAGSAGKCKNNCEPNACDTFGFNPPVYYTGGNNLVSIALGNFTTGDVEDDLVAVNRNDNSISVFAADPNGNGSFNTTPITTTNVGATPNAVTTGDFNKDGKLDLAVALASGGNNVAVLLGNGNATFQAPLAVAAGGTPQSLVAFDYDNDGALDLAVANNVGVRLLKGDGLGGFASGALLTTLTSPYFVAAADFNNDGALDLAVTHINAASVSVFTANGSGGFNAKQDFAIGTGSFNLTIGDFNLDGNKDIAAANSLANAAAAVSVLLGNGNGTFGAKTDFAAGASPQGIATGDLDGDGNPDLITTNGNAGQLVILTGNGAGSFGAGVPVALTGTSTRILVADVNHDGRLDLLATVPGASQAAVLINNCTASAPVITITPTALSDGVIGQSFTQVFTASGGTAPYTFMLLSGSLPNGVTLQPDGTLTGVPSEIGAFTFTIKATDKNGCMGTITIRWQIKCPQITIAPATVHDGTAGVSYAPIEQLTASGGMAPYTFAVTSGLLPTGMQLTSDGKLQGTPTQTGPFSFTVTVTDKFGCKGVRVYSFTINCPTITINPQNATLPGATQGVEYNPSQPPTQTFTATGGCGQYSFSIASGQLPAGMSLTAAGALVGTPTQNGSFQFTVKVTDNCGCMATKVYNLRVGCPPRSLLNRELFNTGVDSNGQSLSPLPATDTHYVVTLPSSANLNSLAVAEFPGWMPNSASPASRWISPFANHFGPGGTYIYRHVFRLTTCDPATAIINGRWMADNGGEIYFNGVKVPGADITVSTGFQQWQSFTINAGFVNTGLNTIEFRVRNDTFATGLRVEFIRASAQCCDCATPPIGMRAWWPLDEPKGATLVNDLVGANHGKPLPGGAVGLGPLPIPGQVAGAMAFIQNNTIVSVPHHSSLNFGTGSFSIDAWIRTGQASPTIEKIIVDKLDQSQKRGYRLSIKGNSLVLTLGDGGALQTFTSAISISFAQWQLVAAVVDRSGSPQTVHFQIPNSSGSHYETQTIGAGLGNIDSNANVRIGGIETQIDELELFGRALSVAEVESIFRAGAAGKCKPCLPPRVRLHPNNLTVCPGKSAVFTAAASGAPAPTVQWQVSTDGGVTWTDIPNATSPTLFIAAGAVKHGNKYRAVFTNSCGSTRTNAATLRVVQPPLACVEPNAGNAFARIGGSGSVSVVLPAGAQPTATSNANWLTIDSIDTGAGSSLTGQTEQSGTIYFTAAANAGAAGRAGGLTISGQNFAVAQSGENPVVTVSAASFGSLPTVSADSIVAAFGVGLATATQVATTLPLPATLAGTTVKVLDAVGVERSAPLFFVSANQVNYLIPPGVATGPALVTVTAGDGRVSTGTVEVSTVAPGLFTADASGRGVPAANALLFRPDGSSSSQQVARFDPATSRFVAEPLDLGPAGARLFLVLFGTGVKARTDPAEVTARIGGVDAPVAYAGAQGGFVGLDQLNIEIPRDLAGRGEVEVEVIVDGQTTNIVTINIR
ncbi:MAG: FG-GAP-like repeat-containing protein [Blastocatellales bacterium]